jgi:hypothetical protein
MRYSRQALVIATLLCATTQLAAAQGSGDGYRPGTLTSVVERHRSSVDTINGARQNFVISAETFPTRATLIFAGSVRPIADGNRELMMNWAKTMRLDTTLAMAFREEWLFREGKAEYWLPFQTETAESMRLAVQAGDSVTVWARFFGAVRSGNRTSWVFPVMRSQSYR